MTEIDRWLERRPAERPPEAVLRPGSVVGEWRVRAFLGRGLSAEVYHVANVRNGCDGALKLLVDESRGLKQRFIDEAEAIRYLAIPSLPRYFDASEKDGRRYYVMEYLQPLILPIPASELPRFIVQVAEAVEDLHRAGYIHRDIKPGNVLRRWSGEPVLIDLGLAKRIGTAVRDPVTRYGRNISVIDGRPVGVGTLDFAAPEQLLKGEASVRSDVYSLGKLLLAVSDGRPARALRRLARRATREDPSERPASAAAFAAAVRRRHWPACACALALAAAVAAAFALGPRPTPSASPFPGPAKGEALAGGAAAKPDAPRVPLTILAGETDEEYLLRMEPLAERGVLAAQLVVAEAYFYGRGTATNREVAVRWYREAAKRGCAEACASLGLCQLWGLGCARDPEAAVDWLAQAAEQDSLGAMNDLAYCYLNGVGVARDETHGFRWAMRAAERGHPMAQATVGECYLDGRGVEADAVRADVWLQRAARQGNKRAQLLLRTR